MQTEGVRTDDQNCSAGLWKVKKSTEGKMGGENRALSLLLYRAVTRFLSLKFKKLKKKKKEKKRWMGFGFFVGRMMHRIVFIYGLASCERPFAAFAQFVGKTKLFS